MASFSLIDCTAFSGGYDFTTETNQMSVSTEVEDLDSTTFGGGGWRSRKGGLKSVEAELQGYWDVAPDDEIFSTLATAQQVAMFSPTGAEGAVAYFFSGAKFSYEMFGSVGELAPFTVSLMSDRGEAGLVRGRLAAPKGDVSATGVAGAAVELGAASASQHIYAAVHVFSAGDTVTIDLESDDTSGFASPSTVATIGPLTATGGTWMTRVAGPETDTFYRFNVSAITGTFSLAAAVGIQ